ncbi:MAG: FkbM family methyltransferase [Anaerolineae bacterium]|nr:FkbM family methyltransferase [Anaerolineae bacterium]
MNSNYFGQNLEDKVLWNFFGKKNNGFFIDVGAFDGVYLSNTYLFELMGWEGICIEPHPSSFEKCKENRPNSICIHAACVGDNSIEQITFYSEELGFLSGLSNREEELRKRYKGRNKNFAGYEEILVPSFTLNDILTSQNQYSPIDFVSIDVEGAEIDVLKGFDIQKYQPSVLLIEANTYEEEIALDNYLLNKMGYFKSRRLVENLFYCKTSNDAIKLSEIRINGDEKSSWNPIGFSNRSSSNISILQKGIYLIKKGIQRLFLQLRRGQSNK